MTIERRKGQKLINGLVESWMIDTGEVPADHDIVSHLLNMDDWEFDQYLSIEDCKEKMTTLEGIQKKLDEEAEEKAKERFAKETKRYGHKRRTIQDQVTLDTKS